MIVPAPPLLLPITVPPHIPEVIVPPIDTSVENLPSPTTSKVEVGAIVPIPTSPSAVILSLSSGIAFVQVGLVKKLIIDLKFPFFFPVATKLTKDGNPDWL